MRNSYDFNRRFIGMLFNFSVLPYFATISTAKRVLWCCLIWYCITIFDYLNPTPGIWLNALGISAVLGIALVLSVSGQRAGQIDAWQTFRLLLKPFCVSSFSSLIKRHGFIHILPLRLSQQTTSISFCAACHDRKSAAA
jgi:hypothetical protein